MAEAILQISRLDGETWRDCARRLGRKYGLEREVMARSDQICSAPPATWGSSAWCRSEPIGPTARAGRHEQGRSVIRTARDLAVELALGKCVSQNDPDFSPTIWVV
jgi:hypothetical protein